MTCPAHPLSSDCGWAGIFDFPIFEIDTPSQHINTGVSASLAAETPSLKEPMRCPEYDSRLSGRLRSGDTCEAFFLGNKSTNILDSGYQMPPCGTESFIFYVLELIDSTQMTNCKGLIRGFFSPSAMAHVNCVERLLLH